jgi:hypothetical protein
MMNNDLTDFKQIMKEQWKLGEVKETQSAERKASKKRSLERLNLLYESGKAKLIQRKKEEKSGS